MVVTLIARDRPAVQPFIFTLDDKRQPWTISGIAAYGIGSRLGAASNAPVRTPPANGVL